jgi:chromosome segregation ATPase
MDMPHLPDNWLGNAITGIGIAGGAIMYARKRLSADKLAIAGDNADLGSIARLQAQLDKAENARAEAEKRADDFADQRNKLIDQIGEMKGQLAVLTEKVNSLTEEVARLRGVARTTP